MRIALINPPPRTRADEHWARYPLLGLAYIASNLRAHGHDVRVYDGKLGRMSVLQIKDAIEKAAPSVVGITTMTVEFPMVQQIAKHVKDSVPKTLLVLGGPHVNAVGSSALDECTEADCACIGEGEDLMCELAASLHDGRGLTEIAGLAFRDRGRIITNEPRRYRSDYDGLPFPAWDLFARGPVMPLLTHRGCPFKCNFCAHNSGTKPRYRSTENVLLEIDHDIRTYAPEAIRFEDETFGLNLGRTKELLRGILRHGYNLNVSFSAQTRVDRIDEEFVQLLRACNFDTLELGAESGNAQVLANSGKEITLEQIERAVILAKKAGLKVWCKFILGHPHETRANMLETANFIAKLNPDRLSVSIMTPFPGTPIYEMALEGRGGYRLVSRDWDQFDKYTTGVLELRDISIQRLKVYQFWCYLKLYLHNRRIRDMLLLGLRHNTLVLNLLAQLTFGAIHQRGCRSVDPAKSRIAPRSLRLRFQHLLGVHANKNVRGVARQK